MGIATRIRHALLAVLLAGLAAPAFATDPPAPEVVPPEAEIETAPVVVDGRELFRVRGASSYPAPVRAAAISSRIVEVAGDAAIPVDAITIAPTSFGIEIRAGGERVMALVESDAVLESLALPVLADRHRQRIADTVVQYRAEREPQRLVRGAVIAVVATAVLFLVFLLLRAAFRRLVALLEPRVRRHVEALPKGSLQFVQGRQIWDLLAATVQGTRWVVILVALYAWLEVVLGQFPWTRPLADDLFQFVADPLELMAQGVIDFIPSLMFLVILVIVVRYGLRLAKLYFASLERGRTQLGGFDPEWALPSYKIVRALVVALALVVAYPYLPGSGTAALQGISVFAGLLVSLGAAGAVANVIAGYFNIFGRIFRVGDMIQVGDVRGEVTQVRLLTTRVRTIRNEEVTIPNTTILTSSLTNFSALAAERGLVLQTEVGIGYEVPWRQVHAMLEEAARRTEGVLADPPAFVLQKQLGDFAVVYQLNASVGTPKGMVRVYSALHQNVLDVFNEHGVQIMTPAYEGDPAEPKLVPRDRWFTAPAKRPSSTPQERQ